MTNYRRLMAENTRRVVNSLVFLVTMFGHDVLTLFYLSSADNNLVFFMTHLFMMTLLFMHCSSGYTLHSGCQMEVVSVDVYG